MWFPLVLLLVVVAAAAAVTAAPSPPPDPFTRWIVTKDIKWCSGGGDWLPGDPFGAGQDPPGHGCPLVPANFTLPQTITACEKLCATNVECLGISLYPSAKLVPGKACKDAACKTNAQCCFRTISTAQKPPCGGDATCKGTLCLEKPDGSAGPNISGLVPKQLPVGATALVGVIAAPGSTFLPSAICRFNSDQVFPAMFVNSSFVRCHPPVMNGDTASLSIANTRDPGVRGGGDFGNTLSLSLFSGLTVAIGRRPYVSEHTGHVLLKADWPAAAAAQPGICSVAAVLNSSGAILSNSSWTLDLSSPAVSSLAFSLDHLPPTVHDLLNLTITCSSINTTILRHRDFQRFPSAGAPIGVSQVDHSTRTLLVDGEPLLLSGWYYSLLDNAETNFSEFVELNARAGMTAHMAYTFPLQMLQGKPWSQMQDEAMATCAATGAKLLMDVESVSAKLGADNTTQDWRDFRAVIRVIKNHPCTLGYYLCDDCCGHDAEQQAMVYRALRELDPYHITSGATNGACTQKFSDGEGPNGWRTLSLDMPLNENYAMDLEDRTGSGDSENTAHDYPMFWTPTVNCPFYEAANQLGIAETDYVGGYSPHQARSTAYAGVVGDAPMPNLILFDYFSQTEDSLRDGAFQLAREFQDLKPSLLAPLTSAQPTVERISDVSLRARAYAEDLVGVDATCIHLIVLNIENSFQPVALTLRYPSLPTSIVATLPYEGASAPVRSVTLSNGELKDIIAPNSVNIYRVGCEVPPKAYAVKNLAPNPDFELPSTLGGVTAWSGGRAGYWAADPARDGRARMFLDTTRPQYGRYSLRINVPTAVPLVQMWSQACIDSYYPSVHKEAECNAGSDGTFLPAGSRYTISLWARGQPSSRGTPMRIEVVTGRWNIDPVAQRGFHTVGSYVRNETVAGGTVSTSWQQFTGVLPASMHGRFLQLVLHGPGAMFVDSTFIGANMTNTSEMHL